MKSLAYHIGLVGIVVLSGELQAQQPHQYAPQPSGNRWDGFYQKGDAMSEKVSGFMRRIFGNGTPPRGSYSAPSYTAAPQQYQRPSSSYRPTVQSAPQQNAGVYGYSTPTAPTTTSPRVSAPQPTAQRTSPVAPARKSSNRTSNSREPLLPIYRERSKPVTRVPEPARNGFYEPPKINSEPPAPVEPQKTIKSDPPMTTASETSNSFKSPENLEPGTLVGSSTVQEKKSKSLSSIFTNEPSPTKNIVETPPPTPPAPEPKKSETTKPTSSFTDDTPVGKKGSKPGRVISPFPPNNELDVTGLDSGSMALDPTTNRVFRIP